MNNDYIMKALLANDNLKDLKYENNILYYNNDMVDISKINLMLFFNNYSQLYIDQNTISANDFFNIMKLHSKEIITKDKAINNDLQELAIKMLNKK